MMKKIDRKQWLPHVIAIVVFLVVAVIYCKPTLEGKVLQQMDVTQWKGMAQNSFEYKAKHGEFPLWSNSIFGGMPAFQITSVGTNPVSIVYVNNILTLNLPKPISFFFLACVLFYFLSQVLKVNPYIGIFGALSYAYATYNPVIISVGHDTKMMAIAYLPAFIASLLLLYERKYLWGAALTALFTGLLISANHLQITYYALLLAVIISIFYGVRWIREKDFKHLFFSLGIVVGAGLLGVAANAVTLVTTYEYSKKTIRGGSGLSDDKGSPAKTGLNKDYAFSYSVFKTEPLVMMFPKLYGGSSSKLEIAEEKSKAIEALQQMPGQLGQSIQGFLQFYWGGIDGVGTSGPPYIGAIVCFLALIGFVVLDSKYKWWILTACILTFMMSWGKYFEGFNTVLLNLLPLYNKFRAPSMILVIPTFLLGVMSILTLDKILTEPDHASMFKKYKKGLIVVAAVFAMALLVYVTGDFSGIADKELLRNVAAVQDPQQRAGLEEPVKAFIKGLKDDRQSMFLGDLLRTLLFVIVAGASVWLFLKSKIKAAVVIAVIGIFGLIDLMNIDVKYLNAENYQDSGEYENVFKPTAADELILKDTGYYRVLDLSQGIRNAFNAGSQSAYFHKSVGGYHPAKLSIYQDLIDSQLYNFPNCMPVLAMLNTKYIIIPPQQDNQRVSVQQNPGALGAAWFVKAVDYKKGTNEVMRALTMFNPKDTAIVDETDRSKITLNNTDSAAAVKLLYNDNDILEYTASSKTGGFAVFSEIYYEDGWVATVDGKETPIVRTNYVLRGLQLPAGDHKIKFEFKPVSFINSNKAAIGSSALIWILLIVAIVSSFRKRKELA